MQRNNRLPNPNFWVLWCEETSALGVA